MAGVTKYVYGAYVRGEWIWMDSKADAERLTEAYDRIERLEPALGLRGRLYRWAVTFLAILGTVLVTQQHVEGFACWIVSNSCLAVHFARRRDWPQVALWGVYLGLAVYGLVTWWG